jgi:HK97 family phage prohead protease
MDETTPERRSAEIEIRAKGRRLEGYAAVFNAETDLRAFTEIVMPGAFAESLRSKADILGLVDHDPARLLARTRSGSLRLAEDTRGLAFDLELPKTTAGDDVLALAERGDLGGASFAFRPRPGGEKWDGRRRELRAVELFEISVITAWPAYEGTSVAARGRQVTPPRRRRLIL